MIFREVIANLLVHREFSNAFPATLTIYKDTVITENWNRPYMNGRVRLDNLKPHPKNPSIANFFKQLGWVEELGSGVRKMFRYCPLYVKGAIPVIEENDIFKLTIKYKLDDEGVNEESEGVNEINEGVNEENEGVKRKDLILSIIKDEGGLNVSQLAEKVSKSTKTVERYIQELRLMDSIEFIGAPKTGGYYIKKSLPI